MTIIEIIKHMLTETSTPFILFLIIVLIGFRIIYSKEIKLIDKIRQ